MTLAKADQKCLRCGHRRYWHISACTQTDFKVSENHVGSVECSCVKFMEQTKKPAKRNKR